MKMFLGIAAGLFLVWCDPSLIVIPVIGVLVYVCVAG